MKARGMKSTCRIYFFFISICLAAVLPVACGGESGGPPDGDGVDGDAWEDELPIETDGDLEQEFAEAESDELELYDAEPDEQEREGDIEICASEESVCIDRNVLKHCRQDGLAWEETACRRDELCEEAACIDWREADLSVDFSLTIIPDKPQEITVEVDDSDLPDDYFLIAHWFDFGDQVHGHGKRLTHIYEEPGVYPVRLESRYSHCITPGFWKWVVIEPLPEDYNRLELTVNRFPDYLNGSIPLESNGFTPDNPGDDFTEDFIVALPHHRFQVNLNFLDPDGLLDSSTLTVTADVDLAEGFVPAGSNLADRFIFEDYSADWTVAEEDSFPQGHVTLNASISEFGGDTHQRELHFFVVTLLPQFDPMKTTETVLLDFMSDNTTITGGIMAGGFVTFDPQQDMPDGRVDFIQEMRAIGLISDMAAVGADEVEWEGMTGTNAIMLKRIKDRIRQRIYRHFGNCPDGGGSDEALDMKIHVDTDTDAPVIPLEEDFDPEGEFSVLGVGGYWENFFGLAPFDRHNQIRHYWRRMVGSTLIMELLAGTPILTDLLNPVKPQIGIPAGDHDLDPLVLSEGFDRFDPQNSDEENQRYDDVLGCIDAASILIAMITAHEMGHTMGLVEDGAPPFGFFGSRSDVSFMGPLSYGAHADYPLPNLMQQGGVMDLLPRMLQELDLYMELKEDASIIDMLLAFVEETRLGHYCRAYLQRRMVPLIGTGISVPEE